MQKESDRIPVYLMTIELTRDDVREWMSLIRSTRLPTPSVSIKYKWYKKETEDTAWDSVLTRGML